EPVRVGADVKEPAMAGAHNPAHTPGGTAHDPVHTPGGTAHDLGRGAANDLDRGATGGSRGGTPAAGDTAGHAAETGGHGTGGHGTGGHEPGTGGHEPGHGGGAGDDAGHVPGEHGGSGGNGHDGEPPAGHRTPEEQKLEIKRQQVERANNDPAWFKKHYRVNGYRRFTKLDGGYGQRLPKLAPDPDHPGKWIAADDLPPAVAEDYLKDPVPRHPVQPMTPETLKHLNHEAATRDNAIKADTAAEKHLKAAEKAYEAHPTPELAAAVDHADAVHSPLHGQMSRASEMYGEHVAEHAAIPEHYPNAKRVDDGALGNNRFDQVYKTTDGRYVVVEAKGSERAQLGVRKGHTGQRVTQGTREYFETILNEMDKRAQKAGNTPAGKAEKALAKQLRIALKADKVDYVLVKAKSNGAEYAGYQMKQFKISPRN
ncbi:hypothetical protein ACFXKR_41830, partial [Streptomyces violascens]